MYATDEYTVRIHLPARAGGGLGPPLEQLGHLPGQRKHLLGGKQARRPTTRLGALSRAGATAHVS